MDVTAITTRDDFLLELGEVLEGQASVRPVDSIAAALEHLTSTKRAQVLVIDSRDVADVRSDIDRACSQVPHVALLVFASGEEEKRIGATLKGSNVFAVLPIPIDKRKTGAVLNGVFAEALAKKAAAKPPASSSPGVTVEAFQPQANPSAPPEPSSKGKLIVWVGIGVAVAALAAGALWFVTRGKRAPAPAPTAAAPAARPLENGTAVDTTLAPPPVVDTSIMQGNVDDFLEKARQAMRQRHYTEPAGDNALVYYCSAAAADPANAEAKDGLQRLAAVLGARFDEAMTGSRYDEAALALAGLKGAAPQDPRIGPSELKLTTAQFSKAIADGTLDRATALLRQVQQSSAIPAEQIAKWRADLARRQEEAKVQRLANLVAERIRDGKLTDPADDSAKTYLQQLHEAAPSSATTQRASRELNSAYLRKAREARNPADAERWIGEARAGGASATDLASFQRELGTARQKAAQAEAERLAQLVRERIRNGQLTEPAQDSAAYYLGQLQAVDPASPSLAQGSHDLAAKLIERAKSAAQSGKSAQVDSDLTQAKRWGADPKDILAVQQVANAPKGGSSSVSPASLAASLKRLKYVPPEYPSKAITEHVNGSVTVEYIVDVKGDPRDVRVVEATPPGVFDRAALAAVKRWHYQPASVNGAAVEVPVRTAIRFELPK